MNSSPQLSSLLLLERGGQHQGRSASGCAFEGRDFSLTCLQDVPGENSRYRVSIVGIEFNNCGGDAGDHGNLSDAQKCLHSALKEAEGNLGPDRNIDIVQFGIQAS